VTPVVVRIPDGYRWLRVAQGDWEDPLDPTFAQEHGGRWNPPRSFPVLYVNADLRTARAQILALFEGQPVRPEDLEDDAYWLIGVTLPRRQDVADAASAEGVSALGLPDSYPLDDKGHRIGWEVCQPIGVAVHGSGLRGVFSRSAATLDGTGRELAWFPAQRSSRATRIGHPVAFGTWWYAADVDGLLGKAADS
jgi:hypothetical protein